MTTGWTQEGVLQSAAHKVVNFEAPLLAKLAGMELSCTLSQTHMREIACSLGHADKCYENC